MEMSTQTQIKERWVMHRALFYNFWYYPNQELIFKDGCAVLRGHNGSGKSVTTQSLITVLLDGDTRSNRLDPFGGKERKISDTVLGGKDLMKENHRIGYMALEFIKPKSGIRKTIGMGIEAVRDEKRPKIWYFIFDDMKVGDGQRDFKFYEEENVNGKIKQIPMNEKRIRAYFETEVRSGKVYSDRKEYADNVNKQLFGFKRSEGYKELMDLLIQLRSPRLSDTKKPEAAAMVLNDSLPSLTDEEIRPLIQSVEAIDKMERDLDEFKKELKLINSLSKTYGEHNRIMFVEKAEAYFKITQRLENTKQQILKSKKSVENAKAELIKINDDLKKNERDMVIAKEEKAGLGLDELEGIQNKKNAEESNFKKLTERIFVLETKISGTKKELMAIRGKLDTFEMKKQNSLNAIKENLFELTQHAEMLQDYLVHNRYFEHFSKNVEMDEYSFDAWENSLKEYKSVLVNLKNDLEKIQKYQQNDLDLANSIGNIQMQVDSVYEEISKKEDEYQDIVYEKKQQVSVWSRGLEHLLLDDETKDELLGEVSSIYVDKSKEAYMKPLTMELDERKTEIQKTIVESEILFKQVDGEVQKLNNEIHEWVNKKDVKPPFVSEKEQIWMELEKESIPFVPFYEAFEFVDGISAVEKESIQNALFETGLLKSVIVPKQYMKQAMKITSVVQYETKKESNLTKVLKVSDGMGIVSAELLEGIAYGGMEGKTFIVHTGQFSNEMVAGQSEFYSKDIYIGRMARENYRKNKIAQLEVEKEKLNFEKENLMKQIADSKEKWSSIEGEFKNFPELKDLKMVLNQIKAEKQKNEMVLLPELEKKQKEQQVNQENLKTLMVQVKKENPDYVGPMNVETVSEKLTTVGYYQECLMEIKTKQNEIVNIETHIKSNESQLKREEENLDETYYSLGVMKDDADKSKAIIENLEKRLKELGQEDAQKRLGELTQLIDVELPTLRDNLIRKETETNNKIVSSEEKSKKLETYELPFEKALQALWEDNFREELNLNIFDLSVVGHEELIEKAEYILNQHAELLDKGANKLQGVKRNLLKQFQEKNVDLPRYQLEMETVVVNELNEIELLKEEHERDIQLAKEQMSRIDITLMVEDIRTSPVNASNRLSERVETLEMDANERDRDLYQNILINTLGDKIARKINYVKAWEKEMNQFMEHEDIVKFRLKWVPKKTEAEGEMDTRKLVEALTQDAKWIDIEKVSRHFRSKIKKAKRQYDVGSGADLQKVMREVLDYRNWFEFEIYFTLFNETEQKLSKSTYEVLSGGQRVLAMITPVLAALNAKYEEAGEDAPRIFTLDEAFARVDDININAMFKYIHKLKFNYILNSQSLWGCFESVPSLNIYELSRPKNRPFVLVQSYYWNGVKRVRGTEEVTEDVKVIETVVEESNRGIM